MISRRKFMLGSAAVAASAAVPVGQVVEHTWGAVLKQPDFITVRLVDPKICQILAMPAASQEGYETQACQ